MTTDAIQRAISDAKYRAKRSGTARVVQTWRYSSGITVLSSVREDDAGGSGATVLAVVRPDGTVECLDSHTPGGR